MQIIKELRDEHFVAGKTQPLSGLIVPGGGYPR